MKKLIHRQFPSPAVQFTESNVDDVLDFIRDLVENYYDDEDGCDLIKVEIIVDSNDETHIRCETPLLIDGRQTVQYNTIHPDDWVIDCTEFRDYEYLDVYSNTHLLDCFAEYEAGNTYNRGQNK